MNPIFKKLHLVDKDPVLVLNAPEEYYEILEELNVEIHDEVQDDYQYVQVFAQEEDEAHDVIAEVVNCMLPGAYFWFCYPKSTSENFDTQLDEDLVNEIFSAYDLEGVTKVLLDADWHAVRLRFSADIAEDLKDTGKGPRKFNDLTD